MRYLMLVLVVRAAAQTVTPPSIIRTFQANGTAVSASLNVSGNSSVQISPSTQSGGNWLSVSPSSGSAPLKVAVTLDPTGLPDGTYLGSVAVGAVSVPVTIMVGNPGPQLPSNGIVSAANYQGGVVSPGEIVAIYGSNIGPQIHYSAQVWDKAVTARLAGTEVWFDSTPAPILCAYPNQLAVVVPYDVAGKKDVQIQVENRVARTPPFTMLVQAATPALFTADGSGKGPVAALNQDGSVNSSNNPAPLGTIVVLYATGAGALDPPIADGTLVSTPIPAPVLPVKVTIGGKNSEVLYAGSAPTLVAGVMQIKARVPPGIPSGDALVVLSVGAFTTSDQVTVSVR